MRAPPLLPGYWRLPGTNLWSGGHHRSTRELTIPRVRLKDSRSPLRHHSKPLSQHHEVQHLQHWFKSQLQAQQRHCGTLSMSRLSMGSRLVEYSSGLTSTGSRDDPETPPSRQGHPSRRRDSPRFASCTALLSYKYRITRRGASTGARGHPNCAFVTAKGVNGAAAERTASVCTSCLRATAQTRTTSPPASAATTVGAEAGIRGTKKRGETRT